jgi:hypothetical protein
MPPLPAPLFAYAPGERLPIDAQQKLAAIARYRSQTESDDPTTNWLSSFARREEITFPERYRRVDGRWVMRHARPLDPDTRVYEVGGFVELNRWGPEGFAESTVSAVTTSSSRSTSP